jgi:branched-chain amino acid transport system substrate-binding protein
MKKLFLVAIIVMVATSVFAGSQVEVKEWTIPFLNDLSGPIASIAGYLDWGAQQAAREINANGGIKGIPVRVVPVDTAFDPQKGTVEMAKVVEYALAALGPVYEPVIQAAMPIAVENQMFSFNASTSFEFASKYFPWTIAYLPPTEKRLGALVAAWAKLYPEMKKVVQFVENTGTWPLMADAHVKGLTGLGLTVEKVEVPADAVTFGPLVVKALDAKPDGIVFVCNPEKISKIIKELKGRGWTAMGKLLVFSSGDAPELYSAGGADINGIVVYNYINPFIDTPRWNAFKAAFAKDYNGLAPFSLSPNYYDAVYMLKEAIEKTGVTGDPKKLKEERKKIADYMANIKAFNGLQFTWDTKDGVPTNKPAYLFTIKDGNKVLLKEVK